MREKIIVTMGTRSTIANLWYSFWSDLKITNFVTSACTCIMKYWICCLLKESFYFLKVSSVIQFISSYFGEDLPTNYIYMYMLSMYNHHMRIVVQWDLSKPNLEKTCINWTLNTRGWMYVIIATGGNNIVEVFESLTSFWKMYIV